LSRGGEKLVDMNLPLEATEEEGVCETNIVNECHLSDPDLYDEIVLPKRHFPGAEAERQLS
jgi:hypothetical protein